MGSFRDEVFTYLDPDGLIGSLPFSFKVRTGGNQLLDTFTGFVLLHLAGELGSSDKKLLEYTTRKCEPSGETGIYDKNPPLANGERRLDDITHDDILGVSMGSSILGLPFCYEIAARGHRTGWILSNNGKNYFTAHAKPWHRAAYLIAADQRPDAWSFLTLIVACIIDGFQAYEDSSSKKLVWLILEATSRKNPIMALVYRFWAYRVRKKLGSLRRIFIIYFGERHPYAKYCPIDSHLTNPRSL